MKAEERSVILLNVGFDIRWVKRAAVPRRGDDFADELRVRDGLSALHDAYNGRLGLEGAVSRDSLMCLLILLLGLLSLDLIDFDAVFGVLEVVVDTEGVAIVDVFAFGVLAEDAIFGAGEGLQCALELDVICALLIVTICKMVC